MDAEHGGLLGPVIVVWGEAQGAVDLERALMAEGEVEWGAESECVVGGEQDGACGAAVLKGGEDVGGVVDEGVVV